MADPKDDAVNAARAFLEGLKNRPPQPWDDIGAAVRGDDPSRQPTPTPPAPLPPSTTSDDAIGQAQRIAERNRDLAKRTRYLRKD